MLKSLTLLPLFLLVTALGCKSSSAKSSDFPCTCGTAESAIEPCLHPLCQKGQHNPGNPDCACGTMTIGEGKK